MKITNKQTIYKLATIAAVIVATSPVEKATASTQFFVNYGVVGIEVTREPDMNYKKADGSWDEISTVFYAPVFSTDLDSGYSFISSLSGWNYDSDPTRTGSTGLLDRAKLPVADENEPQWIVKHGLAPSEIGSKVSSTEVNGVTYIGQASYLSFKFKRDDGEQAVFENINLALTGFVNIDVDANTWAGTNKDGFTAAIAPEISQPEGEDTDVYTFDFSGLDFTTGELEIRIYGVLGQDQGTFKTNIGIIPPPPAVPEPSLLLLTVGGLLGLAVRRNRDVQK